MSDVATIHDVHFDQPRKGKIGMCFSGFVVPYKALMGSIPPSRIHYSSRKMGHRLTHTCSRRARKSITLVPENPIRFVANPLR